MVTPVESSLLTAQAALVYNKEKKPPGHELSEILACYFVIPYLIALCADVSLWCLTCAKNNPSPKENGPPRIQLKGTASFKHFEVDFT